MIQDNYSLLKQARQDFSNGTGHPEQIVRPEVFASWQRSLAFHADTETARKNILSQEMLRQKIAENQTLYDISSSFMDYLYQFVKGSGYMLMFAGTDGYILKIIGDADIIYTAMHQEIPLIEGCCRSEACMGTNGVGTPLVTKEPIQLLAYEHYFDRSSNWTCSGAPILLNGQLLGVICLSGNRESSHLHTLGMVMSAAEAISRQLTLAETNAHLALLHNQLQTSIDAMLSCILLIDDSFRILSVNASAVHNIGFSEKSLLHQDCRHFFPDLNLPDLKENLYDTETTLHGKTENCDGYVSVRYIKGNNNTSCSYLISFRKNEYVRSMVNRVIGSNAHFTFSDIIGDSKEIVQCRKLGQKAAGSNANILILGESGTGKELFAQSIHNASHFSSGPFVAINCGAIPRDLIESELFGYDTGAFTGAKKEGCAGKFELANNGTIFLDEIGDMPYEVQVRLLRVLQDRAVTRVGGKKSIPLNVRVIAATNKNLEQEIENQTFRSDLYYRLNVFSLQIPPLRERGNDVFLLTDYFLKKYRKPDALPITSLSEEARMLLATCRWPGNIRELENAIERACILCSGATLMAEHLPDNIRKNTDSDQKYEAEFPVPKDLPLPPQSCEPVSDSSAIQAPTEVTSDLTAVQEAEKALILQHLTDAGGNAKKAAETLGIGRKTLYRKFEKYNINPNEIRYRLSLK